MGVCVMNLKNLNKKIRRLVNRIEKDTKKLAKFRMRLNAPKRTKRSAKKNKPAARRKPAQAKTSNAVAPAAKKKHTMSPERRAQLSAAMNARWAAKRAAAKTKVPSSDTSA